MDFLSSEVWTRSGIKTYYILFVAAIPTAHSLVVLRIDQRDTENAAGLATSMGGWPIAGRVSHPLDGKRTFIN